MPVTLVVDLAAATPVYEQVRSQLAGHIAAGRLVDGEQLPPIRSLAGDLGIAVNTVNRAYSELESAGLVRTRRRFGTVVTVERAAAQGDRVFVAAEQFVEAARAAGLSDDAAIDLVRAALGRRPTPEPGDLSGPAGR